MKAPRRRKRTGGQPVGLTGRLERSARRSRRQGFEPERPQSAYADTGVFSGVGRPDWKGSHEVRAATRSMARRAMRAEREWLKTLPKGVKI